LIYFHTILYWSATNTTANRTIGSTGQVLTVSSGTPSWATPTANSYHTILPNSGINAGLTRYIGEGTATLGGTEVGVQNIMPNAGTFSNLYVRLRTAQPADNSVVVTVRLNAASTALTVTIPASSGANTTYSDVTHSFTYAAGDLISVMIVNNSASTSGSILSISYKDTE
jgi:hypothetical protein